MRSCRRCRASRAHDRAALHRRRQLHRQRPRRRRHAGRALERVNLVDPDDPEPGGEAATAHCASVSCISDLANASPSGSFRRRGRPDRRSAGRGLERCSTWSILRDPEPGQRQDREPERASVRAPPPVPRAWRSGASSPTIRQRLDPGRGLERNQLAVVPTPVPAGSSTSQLNSILVSSRPPCARRSAPFDDRPRRRGRTLAEGWDGTHVEHAEHGQPVPGRDGQLPARRLVLPAHDRCTAAGSSDDSTFTATDAERSLARDSGARSPAHRSARSAAPYAGPWRRRRRRPRPSRPSRRAACARR